MDSYAAGYLAACDRIAAQVAAPDNDVTIKQVWPGAVVAEVLVMSKVADG